MSKKRKKQPSIKTGKYQSQLEERVAKQLSRGGLQSVKYEPFKVAYTIRKHYVPDFVIVTKSGKEIYIEVKGWFRPEDRTKMRAVKSSNPELDIRILFDKNNKVSSRGKMKYTEWCEKNSIKCAIKTIPKEWFKE